MLYCIFSGMDCLPFGKHVFFVLIVPCVLQCVTCLPFSGQYPVARAFMPRFPEILPPYIPYRPQMRRSWNRGPFYFTRPEQRYVQNNHNFQSHVPVNPIRRPATFPPRFRSFRNYNDHSNKPTSNSYLITRPPMEPLKKISVISGPLTRVIPHPKTRKMSAKKRARIRAVAKAKSFPGILKNTSLDVTRGWSDTNQAILKCA